MGAVILSEKHFFMLIMAGIAGLVIAWCVTFFILRRNPEQLTSALKDALLPKLLTIILIVFATTILAIMNMLTEAVAAIFSGIVGYVLGTLNKEKTAK